MMDKTVHGYLPNGTLVTLNGKLQKVMIFGRQIKVADDKIYDYVGCVYPQGAKSVEEEILFNHDQIDVVFFIGYQDMEELVYREILAKNLEEMKEKTEPEE